LAAVSDAFVENFRTGVLDRMGLGKDKGRLLGEYSKGMRQRAKLAQVLVHDPEVVLLDEPLTGCDPLARFQITSLIKELGKAGKTVIVSSHILHEVEAMTSEILLVYKGQVLAEGNIYRIREMIDEHPHMIRVECDDPRGLGRELVASADVRSMQFREEGARRHRQSVAVDKGTQILLSLKYRELAAGGGWPRGRGRRWGW